MRVDVADPGAKQPLPFNQGTDLLVLSPVDRREFVQQPKLKLSLPEVAQPDFADDKRMHKDQAAIKKLRHHRLAPSPMIYPKRRIRENQISSPGLNRRRGGTTKSGSVPPSRAMRREASRSTRVFNARRTISDFSLIPVNSWAVANNSSSKFNVVRISLQPQHQLYHHLMLIVMPGRS